MIPFAMIVFVIMIVVGGIAVDVGNAYQSKTHLQVAANSAAHAALMAREYKSATEAKAIAVSVAEVSLPAEHFGDTIRPEDIVYGYWDADAEVFTADASSRDAVMVETSRLEANSNPESVYFLGFIGKDSWDIRSQTVFETYYPTCLREGFVAEDVVEVTSGNHYANDFCIHSNTFVDLNTGSTFDSGTIVSMPDKRDLQAPDDPFGKNPGLRAALRDGSYKLRILQRIQEITDGVTDPTSIHYRDYLTSLSPVNLQRTKALDETDILPGGFYTANCPNPVQTIQWKPKTTLRDFVLITNCKISFVDSMTLEDATIITTNTANDAVSAAANLAMGRDDKCAAGGGAQILSMGGVVLANGLSMFGSQIIAVKDVQFTANTNGIEGASIISGQRIDGTASGTAAFCGTGMENNFEAAYFRLAK